jgi:hypothetical protein
LTVAGLLLSTIGGFGSLFNLLVTSEIRAYSRVTPFLAFFAFVGVCAALDTLLRRRRDAGLVVATVVVLIGLWDQVHSLRGIAAAYAPIREEYSAVQAFVSQLEKGLSNGVMVLQLPFTVYLNDVGHVRMRPYDHFKPYVVSRHVQWSYPALSNAQFAWQEGASQLDPIELVALAAQEGFSVILVDKYGYADDGKGIGAALQAVAGSRVLADSERYLAIDIRSVPQSPTLSAQRIMDLRSDAVTTPRLTSCQGAPILSFDHVGPQALLVPGATVTVSRSNALAIAGWAVMPVGNRAGVDVEVAINGIAYPAAYGFERPDVAAYFKTPESLPSGFRAVIPKTSLSVGAHQLAIRVIAPADACFYQSPPITVLVR